MSNTLVSSFLFFVCSVVSAHAQITAEDVLADQLNLLSGFGQVEAATTGMITTRNGIRVEGYVVEIKDGPTQVDIRLAGVELREEPDGSVRVIYPEVFPISISTDNPREELEAMTLTLEFDGLNHVVLGSKDDLRHDVSFERMGFVDFEVFPPEALPAELNYSFALTDVRSTLRLSNKDVLRREGSLSLGDLELQMDAISNGVEDNESGIDMLDVVVRLAGLKADFSFADTEIPEHKASISFDDFTWMQVMAGNDVETGNINVSADEFSLDYDVALSFEEFDEDMPAALRRGQRIFADMSHGVLAFNIDVDTPDGKVKSVTTAAESRMQLSLDRSGFSLFAETLDNRNLMTLPPIPDMPVTDFEYSIADSVIDLSIPFEATNQTLPFHVRLKFSGVEMGESIWGLFDRSAQIPRDPLNFEVDLDGSANLSKNVLDTDPGEMPFGETRARLNALRFSAAGLDLTGTGEAEATFLGDTANGNGRLDMRLTGFNTFLDTLIDMGLLTSEQAMPARMGLGLIARPGDGIDTLISTIEVFEDGSIHANGQRIK